MRKYTSTFIIEETTWFYRIEPKYVLTLNWNLVGILATLRLWRLGPRGLPNFKV